MNPSFAGKVAIVTGGGSGLGEAIGKALAARGARVVLSDINFAAAQRVAGEVVDSGGVASAILQDTARPEDSEKVVKYAVATYGALHYAVNNAGIAGAQAPAGETDLALEWLLRAVQQGQIKYKTFCEQVMAAGCVGYIVSMAGRRVIYYGRTGDNHVEWFPGAK